jgi:hypothetical protein
MLDGTPHQRGSGGNSWDDFVATWLGYKHGFKESLLEKPDDTQNQTYVALGIATVKLEFVKQFPIYKEKIHQFNDDPMSEELY